MKRYAVVETENTILITDKFVEKKDFILIGNRPFIKSKLYKIIVGRKKGIGYKINLNNNSTQNEIAQEIIKKQIVMQIVRGLTKKFAWKEFFMGICAGFVFKIIWDSFNEYIKKFQQPQPQYPQPYPEIPNPFVPISNAIMVVGIIAVVMYFGYKMFKEWRL